jgi:hypothetical protein
VEDRHHVSLTDRLTALPLRVRIPLGLLGLLVVSFLLRSTAIHGRYWIDEGLSVGIASFPLDEIPGALRQDGSPPLYYLLLHLWIDVIGGDGEARTHALSLGFALLAVPTSFALARQLFSERAGWFAAVLTAFLPFLSYYAQETRMYALALLLSMTMAGAFALAFLRGRRGWLPVFVVAGAALIYTHNWGLFMLAGTGLALLPALLRGRVAWRDPLIGFGAISLLYLPWIPTLLYQAGHTGAPWSTAPSLGDLPGEVEGVLGGAGPAVALLLVGGAGLMAYFAAEERDEHREVVQTLGLALLLALLLAFVASQISPGWSQRYFASLLGPLLLLAAGVLARAGNLGLVTVALLAGLWLHPPTDRVNNKSNMHRVAVLSEGRVQDGDVVISTHPEQVPVADFYFDQDVRWADGMGFFPDTRIFDWRDALDRYRAAQPKEVASELIDAVEPGHRLVLMEPIIRTAGWSAPWTSLVRKRSAQWEHLLRRDDRLRQVANIPVLGDTNLPRGVRLVVFERLR